MRGNRIGKVVTVAASILCLLLLVMGVGSYWKETGVGRESLAVDGTDARLHETVLVSDRGDIGIYAARSERNPHPPLDQWQRGMGSRSWSEPADDALTIRNDPGWLERAGFDFDAAAVRAGALHRITTSG